MSTTPELNNSLNESTISRDSKFTQQRHHLAQLNAALIGGHAHCSNHLQDEVDAIQKRIVYQPGADAAFLAQYRLLLVLASSK